MQDDAQQDHPSRNIAGYRPLSPADASGNLGPAALGYIAVAAAFGMMIGLVLAVFSAHARVAAAPQTATPSNVQAASIGAPAANPSGSAPSLHIQTKHPHALAAALSKIVPFNGRPALRRTGLHRTRGLHTFFDWRKNSREHKAKRRPYVSPNPTPAPDTPTALQLATAAAASGPVILGIQGDATIASFDSATGTVQTYEGATYLLAKSSADNGTIAWENYPFNIHYRCDEIGNCKLSHGGVSAIAKLAR